MGFLPVTRNELEKSGCSQADVILASADAYIDSPYSAVAILGHVLVKAGYSVAVLSQPDVSDIDEFREFGQPRLFWGVCCGCVDSMVANYTASGKKRKQDDFTPGGINNRRPDRVAIQYTNAIRQAFKEKKPVVIGGIEASLRRIAHYDFWSDKVRRSVVCDAKADAVLYGMGERIIAEFAAAVADGKDWRNLDGVCYMAPEKNFVPPAGAIELPSFMEVSAPTKEGKAAFARAFKIFSENQDPATARTLLQKTDNRYLVHNRPAKVLDEKELDEIYSTRWMLDAPPAIRKKGDIRALDTIRFGITTHRGCYGQCNFCAIAVHQGRRIVSRSEKSIVEEARRMSAHPKWRGTISDVGGPTANMYGFDCEKKKTAGACTNRRCLFPSVCRFLGVDHTRQMRLLKELRSLPNVRNVFVSSGIRPDLVAADEKHGDGYIEAIVRNHVSGQLKLAPEHTCAHVLECMGKPGVKSLLRFKSAFERANRKFGKRQFLTYYFIAAHPGCTVRDMRELKRFATTELKLNPEQVQIFTPTPLTHATCMYYTGLDPDTMKEVFVDRKRSSRELQKSILTEKGNRPTGRR